MISMQAEYLNEGAAPVLVLLVVVAVVGVIAWRYRAKLKKEADRAKEEWKR